MSDPIFNVWIAHRSSGDGDGSQGDPWNGSTQALFDEHMSNLPTLFPNARLCVHLGPCPRDGSGNVTPFQTKGYSDGVATGGWRLLPGMKIIGSGIDGGTRGESVVLTSMDYPEMVGSMMRKSRRITPGRSSMGWIGGIAGRQESAEVKVERGLREEREQRRWAERMHGGPAQGGCGEDGAGEGVAVGGDDDAGVDCGSAAEGYERAVGAPTRPGGPREKSIKLLTDPFSEFSHPIHYLNSQNVKGFNNQRSNGVSLRISEDTSGGGSAFRVDDGLEDRIQDAITMSLL